MLGMMGRKQRMSMIGGGHSSSHGPYGPQQHGNGERGTMEFGYQDHFKNRAGFLLAAQELINAVKTEDPERYVRAFKSIHKMCHDEDMDR